MPQEAAPLDALPQSLEAAQAEHAEIMQEITKAQQFIEAKTRRGIYLEGVMAAWPKPNRAARRAKT